MPYLIETKTGEEARKAASTPAPFGPGLDAETVAVTAKVEVWGSSFSDPGPDYCLTKVFDAEGTLLGQHRREGY